MKKTITKTVLSFLLIATLSLSFVGCSSQTSSAGKTSNSVEHSSSSSSSASSSASVAGGSDVGNTSDTESESNTESASDTQTEQTGVMDKLVKNFWQGDTMYDETIMLVAETDEQGNVLSAPKAKCLFDCDKILSVKWYYHEDNGGEEKTFVEGTDFDYVDGYIVAKGSLVDNAITETKEFSTNMPYVTDKQLTGEQPFPALATSTSIPSTTDGLYLPFTEGYQIVQMQLAVTYTHAENAWTGTTPAYLGESTLSATVNKLKNKEKVELFVYGDSISTGANTSGVLNINPYMPSWMQLLTDNLSSWYGAKVELTNKSVGGWTSANGVNGGSGWVGGKQIQQSGLSDLFSKGDLKGYVPDVALIGFGMNDASNELSINNYCNNIMSMIKTLRAVNPDCDIILIGTMLANPQAKNQSKNQTEYTQYLSKIAKNYENVSVVDMGAMHADLLSAGKRYTEISSNNVNHPNDFMARIYAMNLLSAFIDTTAE